MHPALALDDFRSEKLDLKQNGSLSSPVIMNLSETFTYVRVLVWHMDFTDNSFNWNAFADNDTGLDNGIGVYYANDLVINDTIKQNDEFAHFSYDINHYDDDSSPKGAILTSQWHFESITDYGLFISPDRQLQFYIQDDLSSYSNLNELTVTVEGCFGCGPLEATTVTVHEATFNPLDAISPDLSFVIFGIIIIGVIAYGAWSLLKD